jgi:hypothetical protein
MQSEEEVIALLADKIRETENRRKKQEQSIAKLTKERDDIIWKTRETLENLQAEAKEKIRLRTEKRVQELRVEKERKRRHSLERVQKEEKEKIRLRTEKRVVVGELRVEHLRKEEELDRLFPS